MHLIYQFRRLVFAQVLMGIVAFCIAAQNIGMLLVAGAVAVLSWYVTEGPSGRPLPRWTTNLGALGAVAWLLADLFVWERGHVIVAMGHFTMWLQILLLYTEKSNREYGQLLVLSLMQMVGASVLSISMLYGVLLAAYCVLALLTVLLFQLKATSDLVLEANRAAAPSGHLVSRPKPVVSRGYRWHFRFTALVVGLVSASIAVAVFVVTPRTGDPKIMGPEGEETVASQRQAGFSEQVTLGGSAPQVASREPVLNLTVSLGDHKLTQETQAWLLRGAALDHYERHTRTWTRSAEAVSTERTLKVEPEGLTLAEIGAETVVLNSQITLRQSGHRVLFTLVPAMHTTDSAAGPAVTWFGSENVSQIRFSPVDQQMTANTLSAAIIYNLKVPMPAPPNLQQRFEQTLEPLPHERIGPHQHHRRADFDPATYARGWDIQRAKVTAFAQRILAEHGLTRDPEAPHDPRDLEIANVLADYLRENYRYTLDNPPVAPHEEPVLEFLFNQRQGHCELFASAHAALCRSLNIPARVITGYRVSDYNAIGGYYVVRQSNAHAWTEVYGGPDEGWRTFDATPPDLVRAQHRVERTWFTTIRDIYEHLEFAWIRSVVAFDQRTREEVISGIQTSIADVTDDRESWVGRVLQFFKELPDIWRLDPTAYTLAGIIIVTIAVAVGSLLHILVRRRRRMAALQLTALPRAKRRGLARRLRFYLTMLEMLERHGYVRPEWQSPFSFAQELAEANPLRFDPVVALTEIFYEVRFGHRELDQDRRQRIKAHLRQLEHALARPQA